MSEELLDLSLESWKGIAIKRGRQLRVALDDKIVLERRIKELEFKGRDFDWINELRHSAEARTKELVELVTAIYHKLEFGDVYQWDDGSVTWEKMREVAGFPSPTGQIPASLP